MVETTACFLPTMTRKPKSRASDRLTSSKFAEAVGNAQGFGFAEQRVGGVGALGLGALEQAFEDPDRLFGGGFLGGGEGFGGGRVG